MENRRSLYKRTLRVLLPVVILAGIIIGIERIAMLKYGINNIKHLFESDLRVLKQIDDK